MPTPVIEALVPLNQAPTTSSSGSATVTASNSSGTTTSIGGCGCCSPCAEFLPFLFSTGGLCAGSITNNVPVYLAMEMEFTPVSPYTLAGYCLPSGKVFVGDLAADGIYSQDFKNCNYARVITTQSSCDGSTFEPADVSGNNFYFYFANSTPTVYAWLVPRLCGCNSGSPYSTGWANSLVLLGDPWNVYPNSLLSYVTHSCNPFSLTMKGTVLKTDGLNPYEPVATVEITFTQATAPFLGTRPKVNRLELPCVHLSPIPIDRANCNCPEKFIYKCDLHGQCRPNSDQGDGIRCCQDCQDFEEA